MEKDYKIEIDEIEAILEIIFIAVKYYDDSHELPLMFIRNLSDLQSNTGPKDRVGMLVELRKFEIYIFENYANDKRIKLLYAIEIIKNKIAEWK